MATGKKNLWYKTSQCVILLDGGQKSDVGLIEMKEFIQNYISLLEAMVILLDFFSFYLQASFLGSLAQAAIILTWAPDSTIMSPLANLVLQLLIIGFHLSIRPRKIPHFKILSF